MNTESLICDDCDVGTLRPAIYADDFKHGDGTIHVEGLECHVCDHCGADPVFADQARRNHCKINDARRVADGMLTGAQIRGIRTSLGMTQAEAGDLIGGGPMAFSKYERGEVIQSAVMDNFLRVLAIYPFIVDSMRERRNPVFAEYRKVLPSLPAFHFPVSHITAANDEVMYACDLAVAQ